VEGSAPPSREHELPSGDVSLVFNLAGEHAWLDRQGAGRRWSFPDAWVVGMQESFAVVEGAGGACHLCGVRLRPEGGFALLGASPGALANRAVDLADLWGAPGSTLVARLREAGSIEARLALLRGFFEQRLHGAPDGPPAWQPATRWAVEQIQQQPGVPIHALAREVGWSRRHLHRAFCDQVGLAPKQLARVHRFVAGLGRLAEAAPTRLDALALDLGYSDQAHFGREFRALAGISPGAYRRRAPGSPARLIEVPR